MSQFIPVTTDEGLRLAATISDILFITEPSERAKEKNNLKPEVSGVIVYKSGTQIYVRENYDTLMEMIEQSTWK